MVALPLISYGHRNKRLQQAGGGGGGVRTGSNGFSFYGNPSPTIAPVWFLFGWITLVLPCNFIKTLHHFQTTTMEVICLRKPLGYWSSAVTESDQMSHWHPCSNPTWYCSFFVCIIKITVEMKRKNDKKLIGSDSVRERYALWIYSFFFSDYSFDKANDYLKPEMMYSGQPFSPSANQRCKPHPESACTFGRYYPPSRDLGDKIMSPVSKVILDSYIIS